MYGFLIKKPNIYHCVFIYLFIISLHDPEVSLMKEMYIFLMLKWEKVQ